MTVLADSRRKEYQGNGVTTIFNGPMAYSSSHLSAYLVVDGVPTLVSPNDYTVSLFGRESGTRVVMDVAPPIGATLLLVRTVPFSQEVDITNQGAFLPETIERGYDLLAMQTQQLQDDSERSIKLSDTFVGALPDLTLPSPVPGAVFGWNLAGDGLRNLDAGSPADWALRTDLSDPDGGGDLVAYNPGASGAVIRSVTEKLSDVVSVKDFGAIGDGVSDDTTAFSAALSQAKEVVVPAGTYVVSEITVPEGTTLRGIGGSRLRMPDAAPDNSVGGIPNFWIRLTGADARLEGIEFDGNGANQSGVSFFEKRGVIAYSADRAVISGCTFTNFYGRVIDIRRTAREAKVIGNTIHDTGLIGNCNGIIVQASSCIVADNHIYNLGNGHSILIAAEGGGEDPLHPDLLVHNTIVANNNIHDTDHVAVCVEIGARGVIISGNVFQRCGQSVKLESNFDFARDVMIVGNLCLDDHESAINLTGHRVQFIDNRVRGSQGVRLGPNCVAKGNIIESSGANGRAALDCFGAGSVLEGNYIYDAPHAGIRMNGSSVCIGNRIVNCPDGIRADGADGQIVSNLIDGSTTGVVFGATSARIVYDKNLVVNTDTPYTVHASADFESLYLGATLGDMAPSDYAHVTDVVIASGAISINKGTSLVRVDTEASAATDDLTTITGGYYGQTITLRTANSGRDVQLVNAAGNIRLSTANFTLENLQSTITLVWLGTLWAEVSRSSNL